MKLSQFIGRSPLNAPSRGHMAAGTSLTLFLLALPATGLSGQVRDSSRLVYHPLATDSVEIRRDLGFQSGGVDLRYNLFLPPPARRAVGLPLVVFYNAIEARGFKDWGIYIGWGRLAAAAGLAGVTYDSRAGGTAADFDALLGALRARAGEFGLDPDRVVVFAASANATRAVHLAMDTSRRDIRGLTLYYGSSDATHFRTDIPVLVVRAGLDNPGTNRGLDALVARALAANAPWTVVNHPLGHHPFELSDDNALSVAVIRRTLDFMREVTQPDVTEALSRGRDEARAAGRLGAGEFREALGLYQQLAARRSTDPDIALRLADAARGAGEYRTALNAYQRARDLGNRNRGFVAVGAGTSAAALGDVDSAIAWLRDVPSRWSLEQITSDSAFNRIRDDPRFTSFLRERRGP